MVKMKADKNDSYDDCCLVKGATPFENAEEAWFWFIAAQQARNDGARITAGDGLLRRPCEPVDILKILDGLCRKRQLLRDHLLVLRHYGRRNMPPERHRVKEARAFYLWEEAMDRLEPAFESKGIITKQNWVTKHLHKATPVSAEIQTSLFDQKMTVA
ncbi:MAG: hypothetical protein ACRBB3_04660 [Alphaproteobacteria bacterium]